jgi:hypothetical protein
MPVPLPTIPFTHRIALTWRESGTGQFAVNVIHIKTGVVAHAPADVMELLDDWVTAAMWGDVVSSAQVTDVAITPLDGVTATQHFAPATPAHFTGGIGGQFIPSTALIVKFTTALRGRNHRGRIYLPFIAEGAVQNGFESAGNLVTMANAWSTFQAALIADPDAPSEQVVASYDRAHGGVGATETTIVGYSVESAVATQRRRQQRNQ